MRYQSENWIFKLTAASNNRYHYNFCCYHHIIKKLIINSFRNIFENIHIKWLFSESECILSQMWAPQTLDPDHWGVWEAKHLSVKRGAAHLMITPFWSTQCMVDRKRTSSWRNSNHMIFCKQIEVRIFWAWK